MRLDTDAVRRAADQIADLGDGVPTAVSVPGNSAGPLGTADFASNVASLGNVGARYRNVFDEFAAATDKAAPQLQGALDNLKKAIRVLSDELHGFVTTVELTDERGAEILRQDWSR